MKLQTRGKNLKETGTVIGVFALLFLLLSVCFDFTYDLNDDMALKDLLSGAYTGEPFARNIQMLFPLSLLLSLPYRIASQVPWFAIFLLACQGGSLVAITHAMMDRADGQKEKTRILLGMLGASVCLFLYELVFVQYTVCAGFLAAAGIVRMALTDDLEFQGFWKRNLLSIGLLLLSFALRPNMMLLLSPFLALVLWDRFYLEGEKAQRHLDRRERSTLLFSVLLILMGLMAAMKISDFGAYSSEKWKDFREFFDARTDVYDYYGIPDYDANKAFYDSIGLSKSQHTLLENYNFGIDENINTETMRLIATYSANHLQGSVSRRLYQAAYAYVYRILHGQEAGFDLLALAGYFFLIRLAFAHRKKRLFLDLAGLFLLRNAIWIYLLYRGRVPERITHPLYLVELLLLAVFYLQTLGEESAQEKPASDLNGEAPMASSESGRQKAVLLLFVLLFICCGFLSSSRIRQEIARRASVNQSWEDLKAYCKSDPEHFYSLDVYSTVAYSEKMFEDTASDYQNFDLAGGWLSKSPAEYDKHLQSGFSDLSQGLLSGKVRFVMDEKRDPAFLKEYYQDQGEAVELTETDRVDPFVIITIGKKE